MDRAVNDPERHPRSVPTGFGRSEDADPGRSVDRRATGLPSDAPTERPTIHSVTALRREDGSFIIPEGIAPPGSRHDTFYARHGKRVLDLVLAGAALVVALPVLGLAALAVRMTMGRPIMFHQERIGLDGRPITVLKLRTMKPDRRRSRNRSRYQGPDRRHTHKTAEHPLLTPVGRFLRKYSIDELPQIFNVLRGDMTIVGPRPELAIVVERYQPWQYARLMVRPGLTGLWQITARGDGGLMHERVDLDVEYLSCLGVRTDLGIIAKTPRAMLGDHKGI
ncbi:MAG TPA: sugar transferase [Acidimicrobiales bacterium]